MSGSSSKSTSRPVVIPFTEQEKRVGAMQETAASRALQSFLNQADVSALFNIAGLQGVSDVPKRFATDPLGAVGSQDLSALSRDEFGRAQASGAVADQLRDQAAGILSGGFEATPRQADLIGQLFGNQLDSSLSRLNQFTQRGLDQLTDIAGNRGLRPGDTPITNIGQDILRDANINAADIIRENSANRARAMLEFPLEAGRAQLAGIGQERGLNVQDIARTQLNLAGAQRERQDFGFGAQSAGLGLLGASSFASPIQQSLRPQVGQTQKSKASSGGISTIRLKEILGLVDPEAVLERLVDMDIPVWKYLPGVEPEDTGGKPHIGPIAEDFWETFGLGDGNTINYLDAIGILMLSVQALDRKLKETQAMLASSRAS